MMLQRLFRTFPASLLACLCLLLSLSAVNSFAQEKGTLRRESTTTQAYDISTRSRAQVTDMATKMNQSCGSYQHNQTWTEACPTGMGGGVLTKVCVHGQVAVRDNPCVRKAACGSHQHNETWAGTCATGLQGSLTYRCFDGNTVISNFNCQRNQCTGTSYTSSCPTTVDDLPMTGSIAYSCTDNVLTMTSNNCYTYNKPCGGLPNGGTETKNCSDYNATLVGNVWLSCNNGNKYISGFNCTYARRACSGHPDASTWRTGCPNGLSGDMGYTCADGTAVVTDFRCYH